MVRGGSLFPEFRHAIVTASLFGGIAVLPRTIAVGLNLEFLVDGAPWSLPRPGDLATQPAGR